MNFFSFTFLIFLIVVFIVYYAISKKIRHIWLLVASYFFYACWNIEYTLILLFITLVSYFAARKLHHTPSLLYLWTSIGVCACILLLFKFWNFWALGLHRLFGICDSTTGGVMTLVAPVGLSFYILEAIGYMIDVYRGTSEPENDFSKYALFLSFFPKIMSGPIERSTNLLKQIGNEITFSYGKVKRGLLYILWGYFIKLLISNRLATIVNACFDNYSQQTGLTLLICIFFYGLQLYTDFSGYSYIAIGIGHTFGFTIKDNFAQPYFSKSVTEFWSRWHISLSSWLKDYIYIPLGGNRHRQFRQYINLMITFVVSGLWHGIGFKYLIWGVLHGVYQIISRLLNPLKQWLVQKSCIKQNCFSYKLVQVCSTYFIINFTWLFFRAGSTGNALDILSIIVSDFQPGYTLADKLYLLDFNPNHFNILLLELIILLIVDILRYKKFSIIAFLDEQNKFFRWGLYICIGLSLILGIIRDYGLEASTFIYTSF